MKACFLSMAFSLVALTGVRAEEPSSAGVVMEVVPAKSALPAMVESAKDDFRPLGEADLREPQARLVAAVDRLNARLAIAGKVGEAWREYLLWDQLQQERTKPQPDTDVLLKVFRRFAADHRGLELVWFLDVRRALKQYLELHRNLTMPDLRAAFEQTLDSLAGDLREYLEEPQPGLASRIGYTLGQLENARQVPRLIRAIRLHLARSNLVVNISADVVAAGLARPVDRVEPVYDVILGTRIRGTGTTVGSVAVELVPNDHFAVIDLLFAGVTSTQSVGRNGPAVICSHSKTGIGTRKRLWIEADRVQAFPAVSDANTATRYTGFDSARGRGVLVERIARRRAYQQKSQAEHIAASHARQRANAQVDREAGQQIGRANAELLRQVRRPLQKRKLFPEQVHFRTERDAVVMTARLADPDQLAAATPPPAAPLRSDLAIRIHQSLLTNFATSAVAGMTYRDEEIQDLFQEIFGEVPEQLKPKEDEEPWAMTFAQQDPVLVTFGESGFRVTVCGRRYYRDEESYPGMNVTAEYKLTITPDGVQAIRQGDLRIVPPRFAGGAGGQLSSREIVIRTLLERRFGHIFEKELLVENFVLAPEGRTVGKMKASGVQTNDGWLTITWVLAPTEELAADAST